MDAPTKVGGEKRVHQGMIHPIYLGHVSLEWDELPANVFINLC